MKGVVLAGGRGTRFRPITHVVNKHLLPVYDKPVIYYPVQTLVDAGIDDILVISDPDYIKKCADLLEREFDANFSYAVQLEPKGIAHAVSLAEDFVDDRFAVILGDNLLFGNVSDTVVRFSDEPSDTAKIFVQEVDSPSSYGVAVIEDDTVVHLEEKPESAVSNYAVTGFYLYTKDVFKKISRITPSERGEYEITDVNQRYADEEKLTYEQFDGSWFDVGTPDGLHDASQYVCEKRESK